MHTEIIIKNIVEYYVNDPLISVGKDSLYKRVSNRLGLRYEIQVKEQYIGRLFQYNVF